MTESARLSDVARNVLQESLGVQSDETYLFFTDFNARFEDHYEQLVAKRRFLHELYEGFVAEAAHRPLARYDKYESTQRHGGEPGENIWRLAFGDTVYARLVDSDTLWKLKAEVDLSAQELTNINHWLIEYRSEVVRAVAAFPWFSMTHTRFTRLLQSTGCRIASMPLLTPSVVAGPLQADWNEVSRVTRSVYDALRSCTTLHLSCPAGTDFSLRVGALEHIHVDTGILHRPGSLGNLPGGEAYLVPALGTANGTLVFQSAPERGRIAATVLTVEEGKIAACTNDTEYARHLSDRFRRDYRMRHVAELGIGTNPLATDVSSMIEGEKIRGTVHVALGDDTAMGGSNEATEHIDHIIERVTLTGRTGKRTIPIIEDGSLLFS